MFGCSKCAARESEIEFLRDMVKQLTKQLTALTNVQAFNALEVRDFNASEYYGGDGDEFIEYDQFGQKIIKTKK